MQLHLFYFIFFENTPKEMNRFFISLGDDNEKDVSAEQDKEAKGAWVFGAHENSQRQGDYPPPQSQGAETAGGLTLPRRHRLKKRSEFAACYEAGRRYFSKNFIVFVRTTDIGAKNWRIGLAVTKKNGSAVARNRIKRILREFFRIHQSELPERAEIVAVSKRHVRVEEMSLNTVESDLLPLLRKIQRKPRISGYDAIS